MSKISNIKPDKTAAAVLTSVFREDAQYDLGGICHMLQQLDPERIYYVLDDILCVTRDVAELRDAYSSFLVTDYPSNMFGYYVLIGFMLDSINTISSEDVVRQLVTQPI